MKLISNERHKKLKKLEELEEIKTRKGNYLIEPKIENVGLIEYIKWKMQDGVSEFIPIEKYDDYCYTQKKKGEIGMLYGKSVILK